ncbi:hypothetical protein O6H91_16G018100 [Diphasiastrum complanatum]|nr:hypothetical protein O6H91_16G018100 [Diphasiastrum complanatum]KAJ7526676.1 hypothetical protein O6H91_16G018100 [Diphasiastrum complanatum]
MSAEPTLSSCRQFSYPASVSEAASHAKFSQEKVSVQNRNKHLGDSDLSLSLGICREQSFSTCGFGSPFFFSNRTGSLPFENVHTLAQQRHTVNHPSDEDSKAASQRLKATETSTAQLTIFYAGAVHIYNDVPKDKAKAIMLLAESANAGSSHNTHQSMETRFGTQSHISNPSQSLLQHCSSSSAPDTAPQNVHDAGKPVSSVGKTLNGLSQPALQPAGNVSYTALPQARRMSLQRFLQKRTERSRDTSPYVTDKYIESGITLPRSRPSSPSANGSRAASPAALCTGSPCRPSAYGDYTRSESGRSSPALTPLTAKNNSVRVSIASP